MESSYTNELPSDMIFEVLSRSSLRTLDSSRIVCKEWNNLTYEPALMHVHARNTNTVSGYLVQSMISNNFKSKFVSVDGSHNLSLEFMASRRTKIEASSDQGWFVCVNRENHRHHRYYICKPSTKKLVALPNPKTRYLTQKIALLIISANPLRFKIVRFSWPSQQRLTGYMMYKCEIFDSFAWAWKEAKDVVLPYGEFLMYWHPAICARGSAHILTSKDRVLAFEEKSESYNIFPLPQPAYENDDDYQHKRIVKYKGRLGFTCKAPNGCLELWVMKKKKIYDGINIDQEFVWKKRMALTSRVLEEKEDYPALGGFCNSGVAVVEGERSVIFYDVRNCNLYQQRLEHKPDELFAFRASLQRDAKMLTPPDALPFARKTKEIDAQGLREWASLVEVVRNI